MNHFNHLTLKPTNEKASQSFTEFRNRDVCKMFTYQCITATLFAVVNLFVMIRNRFERYDVFLFLSTLVMTAF